VLCALALTLLWPVDGGAQVPGAMGSPDEPMRYTVQSETFFDDDPGWLIGLRPGLGFRGGDAFANLGLTFGRLTGQHALVGGQLKGRLDAHGEIHLAARTGLLFRRLRVQLSTGTNLGVLYETRTGDLGLLPTWWLDVRLRVRGRHYLTAFCDIDMRWQTLGFRKDEVIPTTGIGWSYVW